MYARLLIGTILPLISSSVIYLDCDTFVISPIERLVRAGYAERQAGRRRVRSGQAAHDDGPRHARKTGLFELGADYFNSGVMLIDMPKFAAADVPVRIEGFKRDGILGKLYFDQDMLNLIFRDNWTKLPWRFNVTDPQVAHQAMDCFILHYTGRARPWLLYANVAYRRSYRHVMTNELFYRYMRHRVKRTLGQALAQAHRPEIATPSRSHSAPAPILVRAPGIASRPRRVSWLDHR